MAPSHNQISLMHKSTGVQSVIAPDHNRGQLFPFLSENNKNNGGTTMAATPINHISY